MSKKEERKFPLKFKLGKAVLVARDEVQAAAFEKQGFEEVKEK